MRRAPCCVRGSALIKGRKEVERREEEEEDMSEEEEDMSDLRGRWGRGNGAEAMEDGGNGRGAEGMEEEQRERKRAMPVQPARGRCQG